MYCNHCGKDVPDGAKFCNYCKKGLGLQINNKSENMEAPQATGNIIFKYAMIAVTVLMGICTFLIDVTIEESLIKYMAGYVDDSKQFIIPLIRVLSVVALVLGYASTFLAAKFLFSLFFSTDGYSLAKQSVWVTWFQIVSIASRWIMIELFNEEVVGYVVYEMPKMSWLVIVVALVNVFVLVKCYLGKPIVPGWIGKHYQADPQIKLEKTCSECKTTYALGNACPKCGSKSTES